MHHLLKGQRIGMAGRVSKVEGTARGRPGGGRVGWYRGGKADRSQMCSLGDPAESDSHAVFSAGQRQGQRYVLKKWQGPR